MRSRLNAIDGFVLYFFTRASHAFQRRTGRTNYFLAKMCGIVVVVSCFVDAYNYWMPVLATRSHILSVFMNGLFALWFVRLVYLCEKMDERVLFEKRASRSAEIAFTVFDSPVFRFFLFCACCAATFLFIFTELVGGIDGVFLFRMMDYLFFPAVSAFMYFLAVNPLPPRRSSIQEWIESLSFGFSRPTEAKVKRNPDDARRPR